MDTPDFVVDHDNYRLTGTITDGQVTLDGPPAIISAVTRASALRTEVQLVLPYGDLVEANLDDPTGNPVGVAAAMLAVNTGRCVLTTAPDEVLDWLEDQPGEHL